MMVPDPRDVGVGLDANSMFGKDKKNLTNREREELKKCKIARWVASILWDPRERRATSGHLRGLF